MSTDDEKRTEDDETQERPAAPATDAEQTDVEGHVLKIREPVADVEGHVLKIR